MGMSKDGPEFGARRDDVSATDAAEPVTQVGGHAVHPKRYERLRADLKAELTVEHEYLLRDAIRHWHFTHNAVQFRHALRLLRAELDDANRVRPETVHVSARSDRLADER